MQAIVLAGGLGTRLRARVADRPKALAPVAGRPFLSYVLDWLDAGGCTDVVLATGYLSAMIEAEVGTRHRGLSITYSREETPLGTGGAIVQALARLPDAPTLVMNGDTWFGLDLASFATWCRREPQGSAIALREVPDTSRYGTVTLAGERVDRFGERLGGGPGLINAGFYCLQPGLFRGRSLPAAFSIENDFFKPFAAQLALRGYIASGPFIDIGVPDDYDRAQVDLPRWIADRAA